MRFVSANGREPGLVFYKGMKQVVEFSTVDTVAHLLGVERHTAGVQAFKNLKTDFGIAACRYYKTTDRAIANDSLLPLRQSIEIFALEICKYFQAFKLEAVLQKLLHSEKTLLTIYNNLLIFILSKEQIRYRNV